MAPMRIFMSASAITFSLSISTAVFYRGMKYYTAPSGSRIGFKTAVENHNGNFTDDWCMSMTAENSESFEYRGRCYVEFDNREPLNWATAAKLCKETQSPYSGGLAMYLTEDIFDFLQLNKYSGSWMYAGMHADPTKNNKDEKCLGNSQIQVKTNFAFGQGPDILNDKSWSALDSYSGVWSKAPSAKFNCGQEVGMVISEKNNRGWGDEWANSTSHSHYLCQFEVNDETNGAYEYWQTPSQGRLTGEVMLEEYISTVEHPYVDMDDCDEACYRHPLCNSKSYNAIWWMDVRNESAARCELYMVAPNNDGKHARFDSWFVPDNESRLDYIVTSPVKIWL